MEKARKKPSKLKDIGNRKERRQKFEKWISMDMLHKSTGKIPIKMSTNTLFKEKEDCIPCETCKQVFGAVFRKKDKWYCYIHVDDIEGQIEEEKTNTND